MTAQKDGQFVRRPLIAGNWKMNMDHMQGIALVQKLAWTLDDAGHDFERVQVSVFPPFTDLRGVQTLVTGDKLSLDYGAQDLSEHDAGAYTGDISGQFLHRLGCAQVLIGHSERREVHGESDELLNRKIRAALRHELVPVLCVGEGLEVRQAGEHVSHTLAQLDGALEGLGAEELSQLVVAYEPVWAIGTGEVAGPQDAQEMAAAVRAHLAQRYSAEFADGVRVLYGGSVKAKNVASILAGADVDGALVGGASLEAEEFAGIASFEKHVDTGDAG
ncbi:MULTISPECIES: triose-phosphate isomerase [Nesterenkonia]|uniref:Triosephosphate isomerase n=1 Tax=Nesterenkonia xinjiangensis TaxID=225327 RepID=A0A7Z0GQQ8_9MICC|nr:MULTISPECIES: triose-phosphate isomerase [Nesterenkonia]MDZ5078015.1 triose-phosphate isomerase [Nesterenkonia sp. HG001]NYJ79378.1 triosephosphate isomerase [Nesterenkonia xinjiangensis]